MINYKYYDHFRFRLCPKSEEYILAYFKSSEFLDHYQSVSVQLVKDLQTALDDDTFGKYLPVLENYNFYHSVIIVLY